MGLQHSGISRGVGGVIWKGADEHWPAERVAANDNDCDCDAAIYRPNHNLVAFQPMRAAVAGRRRRVLDFCCGRRGGAITGMGRHVVRRGPVRGARRRKRMPLFLQREVLRIDAIIAIAAAHDLTAAHVAAPLITGQRSIDTGM